MKKTDLINELIDKYGYEEADIKSLSNAKLTSLIKKEELDVVEVAKEEKKNELKTEDIKHNELIEVMNGLTGGLIIGSPRSGAVWEFTQYGQSDFIEYRDLEVIRNTGNKLFTDAILIVLDKRVVKKFRLEDVYKHIVLPDDVESIFKKSVEDIQIFLDKAPEGVIQTFVGKAVELYEKDKLNNIRLIKFIEEKFNIDFEDMV